MIREKRLQKINNLKKEKGLTAKIISEFTNLSETQIWFALQGERKVNLDKIEKFIINYKSKPKYFRQTLPTYKRTLEQLLMNGFSYWEAIRIIKD